MPVVATEHLTPFTHPRLGFGIIFTGHQCVTSQVLLVKLCGTLKTSH